jgi:NADPH:quinone reductase
MSRRDRRLPSVVHAIRLHAFGPAENLVYEEVPDPVTAEDQVRIAVEAGGVHLIDTKLRNGVQMGPLPLPDLPAIPGREIAGIVDAIGPGVDERWVGRRVVAHLGPTGAGGYAELAVAPVGALHELPEHVAADVAVAMIGTGRTAVGILDVAALTGDDVALVLAAAGGLGSLFVQAARNVGAVTVGVAGGPKKVERVRALGADVAVDYSAPDWPDRVRASLGDRSVTVVLDGVGGEAGHAAMDLLGVAGRHVLFGGSAGEPTQVTTEDLMSRGLTVTALGPRILPRLRELETRSLEEAAAGRLVPLVQHFPLAQAADAHRALETRATAGKVVLMPSSSG